MMRVKNFSFFVHLMVAGSVLLSACANKNEFLQTAVTEDFVQNLNPPYVDILWMLNDRSPMNSAMTKLIPEATKLFTRLDNSTQSYRMGFASADMEIHPTELRPLGTSGIIQKEATNNNTLEDRVATFKDILNRYINLSTGATELGLASVVAVLQSTFKPRTNVPLVVIFVSDSFDRSTVPGGGDAVDYFEQKLIELKGGNKKLVRVYSINYKPLLAGETVNADTRCATLFNADVDVMPDSRERYFKLAKRFASDMPNPDDATGTLCKSFADNIDISGLRIGEPVKIFPLKAKPELDTLRVSVFKAGSDTSFEMAWSYDANTNSVVFTEPPPEGSNIQILYQPD